MMRTRCPNCATIFRITAEQLRVRFGMVRCGQCQAVFNAFDSLIEGGVLAEAPVAVPVATPSPASGVNQGNQERVCVPEKPPPSVEAPDSGPGLPELSSQAAGLDPIDAVLAAEETPEETARAAREAGLKAVREISEAPGYDRWSARTLETDSNDMFVEPSPRRPGWPFALLVVLLLAVLTGQLGYHYRSEVVARFPDLAGIYHALNIGIPLPRHVELVGIEVSDLQSDKARGLLILQATLRNRAPYDQEWPALELTLTDTQDQVVSRRVLRSADFLPARADRGVFAANSEIGIKLWLESKQPAAGYRLFIFYP